MLENFLEIVVSVVVFSLGILVLLAFMISMVKMGDKIDDEDNNS